jgi:cytochrome c oxidase accessory protein FixG
MEHVGPPASSAAGKQGIGFVTTVLDRRKDPTAAPLGAAEGFPVEPVNRKQDRALYAARQKIYPRLAHGFYRRLKWIVMAATLGIYYGLPWLRWNRGPDLPDQAVLLDMANNRFFFFFLEIWPQEFYFVTGLLILAALVLFLVTSAAGRVWCGYTCPQTVWTDLMIVIERFWQGDRNARIRLDKEPWGALKLFKKGMTHLSWLAVGLLTGGALVFYFRDAPTLVRELISGTAPFIAYLFLGIFALTTYVLGGLAREQVCTYMCPWPRIQGAMTDSHTLLVSYKIVRGEPRGAMRKGVDGAVDWSRRGDCIDCKACIAVCPAGIDIRDGSQLECIQCALCIDACDEIMDRISRPRGLIAYETVAKIEANAAGRQQSFQLVRPRTMLYAGLSVLVGVIMLAGWLNRSVVEVNVLHDRNPPYVRLTDGSIRNGFTVKILNKLHMPRDYSVSVKGIADARAAVVGLEDGAQTIRVATDTLRELRVFVTIPKGRVTTLGVAAAPITISVRDLASGAEVARGTTIQLPPPGGRP